MPIVVRLHYIEHLFQQKINKFECSVLKSWCSAESAKHTNSATSRKALKWQFLLMCINKYIVLFLIKWEKGKRNLNINSFRLWVLTGLWTRIWARNSLWPVRVRQRWRGPVPRWFWWGSWEVLRSLDLRLMLWRAVGP